MLQSYIKIALRTFRKNKVFTGVSLFGISFTLMVVMVALAFSDTELGKHSPISKKDRIVSTFTLMMRTWERNEEVKIDTTLQNGIEVYDTTRTEKINKEEFRSQSNSELGEDFIKEYIYRLNTPQVTSMYNRNQIDVFVGNEYISLPSTYCESEFFQIFDYQFIEGAPFDRNQVEATAPVIILSKKAAEKYFGKQDSYVGKVVIYQEKNLEVVGIIKDIFSNVWQFEAFVPYTHLPASALNDDWGHFGSMQVAWLLGSKDDKSRLSQELRNIEAKLEGNLPNDFDIINIIEKDINNYFSMFLFWDPEKNTFWKLSWIFSALLGLFILVPIMNLMNLNTNRILNRSGEIGVRKAFGARTGQLITQFIVENVLLTLFGGALGLIFTLLMIRWINESGFLDESKLIFYPGLFFTSFLVILIFGILSGFLPAWRSSRLPIAQALKTN